MNIQLEILEKVMEILFSMNNKEADKALSLIKEAIAEYQSAEPVGWENMDTAPKDGSEFVVRHSQQGNVKNLIYWSKVYKTWMCKDKAANVIGCEWRPIDYSQIEQKQSAGPGSEG